MRRTGHLKLWVFLCSGVALGAPAFAADTPPPPAIAAPTPDATITADLKARMDAVKLLQTAQISILTSDGVVTLVGTVPSSFARERALEIARATPGVVRVDDYLRLGIESPGAPTQN